MSLQDSPTISSDVIKQCNILKIFKDSFRNIYGEFLELRRLRGGPFLFYSLLLPADKQHSVHRCSSGS